MKYLYDLHIHSALSPCAENNMTPVNIVGTAKILGLDFVAIADHNAIGNVEVAMQAGEFYDVVVIPAMELQTSEDIHILCLFDSFKNLNDFYQSIEFLDIKNRKEIFGEQLVLDLEDNIVYEEERMLIASAIISSEYVVSAVEKFGGVAIPAHINRDMNGMLQILGDIVGGYKIVEISSNASEDFVQKYSENYKVLINSDAHTLDCLSTVGEVELENRNIVDFLNYLRG